MENIRIYRFKELDSTNNYAKMLAQKGEEEGAVVVADSQTKGKGRLGRSFSSPENTGLYLSIILRPEFSIENAAMITTAAAAAAAIAIEKLTGEKAYIKWVNDIYVGGKKVAGILTESSADFVSNRMNYVILGVGINVSEPEGGFNEGIKSIAGALYNEKQEDFVREKLLDLFLEEFNNIYVTLPKKDYINEYRKRSFLIGKEITFIKGDKEMAAKVLDVDDDTHLIAENEKGEIVALSTGEVNIKKDEKFFRVFESGE